ncbi:MAG: DUF6504 family protein [Chloroflexota bacterium]|mgnify:CR=1 FL=1
MKAIRFIEEPIEVRFDEQPALEKKPPCPNGFTWRGENYRVLEMLAEWHDYKRRGRMARNTRRGPAHAARASIRGSWGVGRDYFRVRVEGGRLFELYYDREPKDADRRKGGWFLAREVDEE